MPITLVGYYESVDPAAAFVNLNAIPDPPVTVNGDDILVPKLNKVIAAAAVLDQTVAVQARLHSPKLAEMGFDEYLSRIASGLSFGSPPEIHARSESPLELDEVEAMQFQVLSNPAAGVGHYGLVWLSDGPVAPVQGDIRTIRCTTAISLSAGLWVNGALTFPVSLRAGTYQVVGMRITGTNLVAARLVFPGGNWRPGAPAINAQADQDYPLFRQGRAGVWGEFAHSSPPTMDALGVTDTAQEIHLDVIRVG